MGAGSGMGTRERLLQMALFASFPLHMLKFSCFCGMMSDLGSLAGFPLQEGTPTTPSVASSGMCKQPTVVPLVWGRFAHLPSTSHGSSGRAGL